MSVTFPNVPDIVGVPAVMRLIGSSDSTPQTPLPRSNAAVQAAMAAQWGLYTQSGDLAADWDNVVSVDVSLDSRISDYPVEKGGFATYNKVIVPNEVRLILSKGGSVEDRQDFLWAIQDAYRSINLYNVIIPEYVYLDMNVTGVRTVRSADHGMGLLVLEISLRKVRQTAKLAFTSTKDAASAGQTKDGPVQTSTPTAAETSNAGTPR